MPFNIYRSTSANGPWTLVQSGITGTGYVEINVPFGSYYYGITAVDASGESAMVVIYVNVTTPQPQPPNESPITTGTAPVNVTWPPVLDIRDEEQLAADAIAYTSGALTVERIERQMEIQRRLREMVAAGRVQQPICPELTNANPSSPHTVLLEAQAWLIGQVTRRLNAVPLQNVIEFHRLFGIEPRPATHATAQLKFTVQAPPGTQVIIPAGTRVSTDEDDETGLVFATDADLAITAEDVEGRVSATCTRPGPVVLAPHTLTTLVDTVAFVDSVTNPDVVDSGSDAETVEQALARARSYQRRGERIVSTRDLEEAILYDALGGEGIVRAFPYVRDGDWANQYVGHTTVIVMTRNGNPVSDEIKTRINSLLEQLVGNQFIYVKDPIYRAFDVEANVRLEGLTTQAAVLARVEQNLRDFYSVSAAKFGRAVLRAEIIQMIEATPGVDRIMPVASAGPILISPASDIDIAPYELAQLRNVTLHVV